MAKSMFDDLKKYLGSTARDPAYVYGNILPYRAKVDSMGKAIPGTVDWGLGYSNAAKGMFDTLIAPRQALQGQSFTPEQAMNFAMNVTAPGVATAKYSPGMFNMPIVYHGTPHRFAPTPDNPLGEFDASKIGTGEGAQMRGHGIYLAEEKDVARSYATNIPYRNLVRKLADVYDEFYSPAEAEQALAEAGLTSAQMRLIQALKEDDYLGFDYPHQALEAALRTPENFELSPETKAALSEISSLYKADLPDEMVDRMLDWDKPLSEQPQNVIDALSKTKNKQLRAIYDYATSPYSTPGLEGEIKTMGEAVKFLGMNTSPTKASALFREEGIPGIKYLDQGSRGKGKGTRNFVLFPGEEKKAKIIKRD